MLEMVILTQKSVEKDLLITLVMMFLWIWLSDVGTQLGQSGSLFVFQSTLFSFLGSENLKRNLAYLCLPFSRFGNNIISRIR
jgi:hypothetical protein